LPRHITIVGSQAPYSLESSFARGLEANGVTARIYDPVSPLGRGLANRIAGRLLDGPRARLLGRRTLADLSSANTDLFLVVKGAMLAPGTISALRRRSGKPIYCFNPDNPFNSLRGASNDRIRAAMCEYDGYLIWGRFLIDPIHQITGRPVDYLPFGFDPTLSAPVDSDDEAIPVGFIGAWDPERAAWLRPLADLGLRITGAGWERLDRRDPLRSVVAPSSFGLGMARIVGRTGINLNLIRPQNASAHNMRTFEIPACRGFMLTSRTEEQQSFFAEGEEIACFASPQELRETVVRYLADPARRRTMAQAAMARVQPHSYAHRMHRLLEIASQRSAPDTL
jgi:hypothetical protein